ncbi:spore germination protein [Bacillus cereus]
MHSKSVTTQNKNSSIAKKDTKPIFLQPQENYNYIKKQMNQSEDLMKQIIPTKNAKITILFVGTVVDKDILQNKLIDPLIYHDDMNSIESITDKIPLDATSISTMQQAIDDLLHGSALLFLPESHQCLSIDIKKVTIRTISEPTTEKIVRGSHDGFIENLNVNINVLRNRIVTPDLTVHYFTLGQNSNGKVALIYIKDLADVNVVKEVKKKLSAISLDYVIPSSSIEKLIESSSFSPLPQLLNTERPDQVMNHLLKGKVVLLEDNNPNALILPVNFFSFYQSPEDFNSRIVVGLFFRLIRLLSILIALLLPSLYIAIVGFHFELLPHELVLPIKTSIQGIPYPPLIEALLMELILELIREAGIRLPTAIGQTIGVVGGLVIGDAVVKAGLVSNTMIVVIALTAIASFITPSSEMSNSIRILRFYFMVAASFIGLPGISFACIILAIHMCQLESWGTPYLAPFAPLNKKILLDIFLPNPFSIGIKPFLRKKKKTCNVSNIRR